MSRSNQLAGLITATPTSTLDTINEINTSLNNDNDLSGTLTGLISGKASKSGDTFTGALNVNTSTEDMAVFTGGVGTLTLRHGIDLEFNRNDITYVTNNNASGSLQFRTGGQNNRLHITSDGNAGIATTPSNFNGLSFSPILDVNGHIQSRAGSLQLGGSTYRRASLWADNSGDPFLSVYVATSSTSSSVAERMRFDKDGKVGVGTNDPKSRLNISDPAGATTLIITDPTRNSAGEHWYLRNTLGNLYIGQATDSSGAWDSLQARVTVENGGYVSILSDSASYSPTLEIKNTNAGAYGGRLKFVAKHNSTVYTPAEIRAYGSTGASDGVLAFETAGTERMRINGQGSVRKNFAGSYAEGVAFGPSTESGYTTNYSLAVASNDDLIRFADASWNLHGQIRCNGDGIALSSASDYRVKENVTPLENALERINKLSPKRFTWKNYPDLGEVDGFIAHEVTKAVPEAVDGEKDRLRDNGDIWPQGLDMTKLVPLLTASIQELSAKVTALESAS